MEANNTETNYICFGDEMDSDEASNDSIKTLCCKKDYFILNNVALFEIMRIFRSDMFCSGKHILYSQGFDFLQF